MAHFPDFEGFLNLDYNTLGNHGQTGVTLPTAFQPGQAPFLQAPAGGENVSDRLVVIEALVKWIYDNQLKIIEQMDKIMAKIDKVEERVETVKAGIVKFSEDFNYWIREGEGKTNTETTYEEDSEMSSEDEEDRFTDVIVDGKHLS